ncbi:MAG TPA: riboflavin kinase [Candidatus Paceibacterota bacterium]|nr:riboflavin kinase [Candidatus Paceibacterota bacterium]
MEYQGKVIGGSRRANALGFPTANIAFNDSTAHGVYAARVTLDDKDYQSVAFADPARGVLEAHLFDFDGDLYGKDISITLIQKLRDSERFENDEDLKAAMVRDAEQARSVRECKDVE